METYLTIVELALYLKLAEQTVRRWVMNHEIPFCKIKKVIRFRLSEVEQRVDNKGAMTVVAEIKEIASDFFKGTEAQTDGLKQCGKTGNDIDETNTARRTLEKCYAETEQASMRDFYKTIERAKADMLPIKSLEHLIGETSLAFSVFCVFWYFWESISWFAGIMVLFSLYAVGRYTANFIAALTKKGITNWQNCGVASFTIARQAVLVVQKPPRTPQCQLPLSPLKTEYAIGQKQDGREKKHLDHFTTSITKNLCLVCFMVILPILCVARLFYDCPMEDSGILKLTGIITDYSIWDDTIHLLAEKFHDKFNVYPNILLACDYTYRKIDLYAQMHPDRIVNEGDLETIETSNEPYEGISNFVTEDYNLHCCLDYDLAEGAFTLVFDEAPDFDGEPIEEPEDLEHFYTYKRTV